MISKNLKNNLHKLQISSESGELIRNESNLNENDLRLIKKLSSKVLKEKKVLKCTDNTSTVDLCICPTISLPHSSDFEQMGSKKSKTIIENLKPSQNGNFYLVDSGIIDMNDDCESLQTDLESIYNSFKVSSSSNLTYKLSKNALRAAVSNNKMHKNSTQTGMNIITPFRSNFNTEINKNINNIRVDTSITSISDSLSEFVLSNSLVKSFPMNKAYDSTDHVLDFNNSEMIQDYSSNPSKLPLLKKNSSRLQSQQTFVNLNNQKTNLVRTKSFNKDNKELQQISVPTDIAIPPKVISVPVLNDSANSPNEGLSRESKRKDSLLDSSIDKEFGTKSQVIVSRDTSIVDHIDLDTEVSFSNLNDLKNDSKSLTADHIKSLNSDSNIPAEDTVSTCDSIELRISSQYIVSNYRSAGKDGGVYNKNSKLGLKRNSIHDDDDDEGDVRIRLGNLDDTSIIDEIASLQSNNNDPSMIVSLSLHSNASNDRQDKKPSNKKKHMNQSKSKHNNNQLNHVFLCSMCTSRSGQFWCRTCSLAYCYNCWSTVEHHRQYDVSAIMTSTNNFSTLANQKPLGNPCYGQDKTLVPHSNDVARKQANQSSQLDKTNQLMIGNDTLLVPNISLPRQQTSVDSSPNQKSNTDGIDLKSPFYDANKSQHNTSRSQRPSPRKHSSRQKYVSDSLNSSVDSTEDKSQIDLEISNTLKIPISILKKIEVNKNKKSNRVLTFHKHLPGQSPPSFQYRNSKVNDTLNQDLMDLSSSMIIIGK